MRKRTVVCLVFSVLAALLATPLSAQSNRMQAHVPFDFIVGSTSLPAGEYSVDASHGNTGNTILYLTNPETGRSVLVAALRSFQPPAGKAVGTLIFHRYGKVYFLSGVENGLTASGYLLLKPKAEKALMEGAALRGPAEEVTVLARR